MSFDPALLMAYGLAMTIFACAVGTAIAGSTRRPLEACVTARCVTLAINLTLALIGRRLERRLPA